MHREFPIIHADRDCSGLTVPVELTDANAEKARMTKFGIRTAMMAIFTSNASIFFPRYSGERPTIKPAIKTVRMINMTIPYNPASDSSENDLTQHHVYHCNHSCKGCEAVVHRIYGTI